MKRVLDWIKSNPITVASIVVVLVSLGFLVWVQMQGSALEERMAERRNQVNNINRLMNQTVEVPSEAPDDPPQTITNVTINPVAIDRYRGIYDRMNDEYTRIFERAVAINQTGHVPLANNLFPTTNDPALPYAARETYKQAFEDMLEAPSGAEGDATPQGLPRLDAGMPPPQQVIDEAVQRVQTEFMSAPGIAATQLTAEEQQTLFNEKRAKAIELLLNRAREIHIYAETDPQSENFPFDLLPWADVEQAPKDFQLWEGQLELWIQEDIARAIAITNHASNPDVSVVEAPIKRLLRVDVIPGYVGLHTLGGLSSQQLQETPGPYSAPAGGLTGTPDKRVSDNFFASPTGRVSNALYDVRHVRVDLVADAQRLPQFFNNLAKVNFMTVLSVQLRDVDEYEALQQGFIYGHDDVVQASILIETIWLRDWTMQYMPSLTRQYLGIDEATDLEAQTNVPGMYGPNPFGGNYVDPYSEFRDPGMGPPME